jgi:hypothetical protein
MTLEQAKQKIAELKDKQVKTRQDIIDLQIAFKVISSSWTQTNG